jgi:hypothetical protein
MAKRTPTEEEAGIALTADELAVINAPPAEAAPDDYPEGGDPDPVETETAPDPEPAKAAEQPKQERPPGFVDERALQESRAKEKEARAREKLLEERFNTLLEVVNRTTAKPAEAKQEAPAKPDLLQNPIEFIDFGLKDVNDRLAKIEGTAAEQQSARQAEEAEQREVEAALQVARPQFNEAAAADPTIGQTHSALLESIAREIAWQNRIPLDNTATPQQREYLQRELTKIENAHIKYAVSTGQNVVDYMKGFAASRGVSAVQPQQAPTPEPKTIAERRSAQQRHQSLSDAPGSEAPTKLSVKDIAKMSPKEYAALVKKIGDAGMDELMGASGNA